MESLKILVVEDSDNVAHLYKLAFSNPLFDLSIEPDGEAGLVAYQARKPDVLVLDIMLPKLSGYVLLKKIRTELKDQSTVIVMATGLSSAEDVRDCVQFNIQGYIVKPFQPKTLPAQIIHAYGRTNPDRAAQLLQSLGNPNSSSTESNVLGIPD